MNLILLRQENCVCWGSLSCCKAHFLFCQVSVHVCIFIYLLVFRVGGLISGSIIAPSRLTNMGWASEVLQTECFLFKDLKKKNPIHQQNIVHSNHCISLDTFPHIWSSCSHLIVILVTVNIWLLFDLWVYMHVPLTDEYWIIFLTNPLNVSQRFNFSCFIGLSLFLIILF